MTAKILLLDDNMDGATMIATTRIATTRTTTTMGLAMAMTMGRAEDSNGTNGRGCTPEFSHAKAKKKFWFHKCKKK